MFTRPSERVPSLCRGREGWGLVRFLSLSWSLGKTADGTGAHKVGIRWQIEFGPDGLAGDGAQLHAPAVGEGVDEEEAAA